ncbi:MAG: hypothetical protein IKG69_03145 [Atopobiaceae bacterium]|nr:hypothetical protein [Atopobiaceae bacterium]
MSEVWFSYLPTFLLIVALAAIIPELVAVLVGSALGLLISLPFRILGAVISLVRTAISRRRRRRATVDPELLAELVRYDPDRDY